jgi:hypothetical protein
VTSPVQMARLSPTRAQEPPAASYTRPRFALYTWREPISPTSDLPYLAVGPRGADHAWYLRRGSARGGLPTFARHFCAS